MLKCLIYVFAPICLSLIYYFPFILSLTYIVLLSACCVLGVFVLTLWGHLALSSPHQTSLFLLDNIEKEARILDTAIREEQSNWIYLAKKPHLPVIFGRTVDSQLQLLIDYFLRDFVTRWLKELSYKPEPVIDKFKEHIWSAVQTLYERLLKVDAEKLLANDIVTKITQHFERIRIARSCALELNQAPVFALASHLMSSDTELHYLRQISDLIVMFLMPRCYSLSPVSYLVREILACKILQPAIDLITEPDYINQKIMQYLEAQKEVDAMHIRTHEYAKTFEDYIRLINNCNNVDTLKRLRYDIVTQIMQATTLQNIKRAKGVDVDVIEKTGNQHNVSRQQVTDAKKLKRYIDQLTIAKAECEEALRKLGWDGAFPAVESDNKALAALRASLKPESPALAMLANEVERLAGEQMRLEAHLARTDTWAEHLGRWRATVHSAEIIDESKPPQFVIVVHMAEQEPTNADEKPEQISTGWVLLRTLNEFQELHRKLRPMCSELKNLELPSNSFKFIFGKNDKNSLDKAKTLIQKYLEFVLEDDRLNQSEALYTFLNPSSEYLKQGDLPKKNKFSFSTLFKSTSSDATARSSQEKEAFTHMPADEDEISLYLDGNGGDAASKNMNNSMRGTAPIGEERDSIAEPLYALLSEVFDMRGVFRWLRKTLVTFVQITYGRTINRQIKETISWLFSEQMLHYYTGIVLKSWWPGGVLSETTSNRNIRDKGKETKITRGADPDEEQNRRDVMHYNSSFFFFLCLSTTGGWPSAQRSFRGLAPSEIVFPRWRSSSIRGCCATRTFFLLPAHRLPST
ncbi:sorting nexin-25 isoform X6 [Nymphalis io]|uniref:sorting nexin-25 isoform X6 n=1 Tax=Inachis io TaxID=171585 RepID=UPI00216AADA1|nr:sorting nexin-25 isoform X6 [Nymphalis io]